MKIFLKQNIYNIFKTFLNKPGHPLSAVCVQQDWRVTGCRNQKQHSFLKNIGIISTCNFRNIHSQKHYGTISTVTSPVILETSTVLSAHRAPVSSLQSCACLACGPEPVPVASAQPSLTRYKGAARSVCQPLFCTDERSHFAFWTCLACCLQRAWFTVSSMLYALLFYMSEILWYFFRYKFCKKNRNFKKSWKSGSGGFQKWT